MIEEDQENGQATDAIEDGEMSADFRFGEGKAEIGFDLNCGHAIFRNMDSAREDRGIPRQKASAIYDEGD